MNDVNRRLNDFQKYPLFTNVYSIMKSEIDLFVIKEIRRKRKELGYSQRYLADCLNLSRSFIGNIENPKRASKYKVEHLNEIAKILKCSIKDFFPDRPL